MKVAIVYDRVNKFGGAERVLVSLHEIFPDAPLYTSVFDEKNAKWAKIFPEIHTSFLNKIKFFRNNHEFLFFLMPFIFSRFNFDKYDLVISVTSEFAKNLAARKHICYCLTPTRYLWSGYDEYFKNKYLKFITKPLINYLRKVDTKAARKPDVMIAISTEVQRRIKKYYKRNAKIIFPPAALSAQHLRAGPPVNKNYYLVVSRLVKYKKVDLVIEAFNELNLPLVIVGTGREERKLKKLARLTARRSKKNIFFAGFVDEKRLGDYYKNAKALIFPQVEDFGITAVEAQMYGIPVIAYKRGGSIDTVTKNTGIFFEKQTKASLVDAIKRFEKKKFNKDLIKDNAKRFSERKFRQEFLHFVKNL